MRDDSLRPHDERTTSSSRRGRAGLAVADVLRPRTHAANMVARACANDVGGPEFFVVGHRGSPVVEVENTMESLQRAVHDGANALEVDVCVTREREVVLWHDYDPNEYCARFRQWGLEPYVGYRPVAPWNSALRKPTSELSLSELRRDYGYARKLRLSGRVDREIPRLARLFEWASRERRLELVFLDMKIPKERIDLVPTILATVAALEDWYRTSFEIILESDSPEIVREVRKLAPSRGVVLDVEPHAGFVSDLRSPSAVRAAIRHRLRRAVAQKPRCITLFPFATHRKIIEQDMALLRKFNEENPHCPIEGVCSFLINEPEEMQHLVSLGVTAIQTDRPQLLRAIAEAHGHRFAGSYSGPAAELKH